MDTQPWKQTNIKVSVGCFAEIPRNPKMSATAAPNPGLKMTALSVPDVVKVLSKASGRPVTETMVRADIQAGAPVNSDGSMNLLAYAAWLVRETSHGD
jgi:hypothetical protein